MIRLLPLVCVMAAGPVQANPVFQDITHRLPEHQYTGGWEHFVGGGVSVFDCSNDGLPDIVAAGGTSPMILLKNVSNEGEIAFDTVSALDDMTGVTGAYPVDIDGDAVLDLYVMRVGPDRVLRGGPDCGFTDVTDLWAIPQIDQWTTAFTAWWDAGAKFPTLAVGHYVDRADPEGPFGTCDTHTILTPSAGNAPRYTAMTLEPGYCTLSMLAAEDARGVMSLRISNDRHYYLTGGAEQLWDIHERRFLGLDDGFPAVSLWGMGIASRDLTGDDRDELMLTSMGDQLMQIAQSDGSYVNAPYDIGTYAHNPYLKGDGRPSTGWHATFGDVNNDALPDLFIAKGNVDQMPGMAMRDPNNLLIQGPDGKFTEAGESAGIADVARSRGAGLADFDGDGLLDLIVVNRRAPMRLYQNATQGAGNAVSVQVYGAGGNRFAIGARVSIRAGDMRQNQQVTIGGGHAGAVVAPLHFGIGPAHQAQVTVRWPDGSQSDGFTVNAGDTLTIRQAD
ncbi:Repeat domain-containing protein [Sulfitobacter marinus]|uniref:Repeat domain-containing protein n=1 Tax=Sulfitobacter marinus TaxID=394264 RepID=A0A1I6T3Z0_9RHOB|nr:CRTAC1 family protein [Sulfitobacter marinus]SFS83748.1 Repeat domain-containing protein [Sulfitobacter marinus]